MWFLVFTNSSFSTLHLYSSSQLFISALDAFSQISTIILHHILHHIPDFGLPSFYISHLPFTFLSLMLPFFCFFIYFFSLLLTSFYFPCLPFTPLHLTSSHFIPHHILSFCISLNIFMNIFMNIFLISWISSWYLVYLLYLSVSFLLDTSWCPYWPLLVKIAIWLVKVVGVKLGNFG